MPDTKAIKSRKTKSRTKANLKSRKASLRASAHRTRKNIKHEDFLSRKTRIVQAAIAGAIIQEQVAALQGAGAIPAPPRIEGLDPLNQVLELDQAAAVLHAAADHAADPVPLHRQINIQLANVRRNLTICVHQFTVHHLISIFMGLVLVYYSSFPLHVAPRETSLFDTAASHLSIAGTVTGLLSMPVSGVLSQCALAAKTVGKIVRNYNARTGRYPNTSENAARRVLNLAEYNSVIGQPLSIARYGGIAATTALDVATKKPVSLFKIGHAVFMSTYSDIATNIGSRIGMTEENVLKKSSTIYRTSA